jgi:hypothetical protein
MESCSCPLLIHPCCFTPGLKCQETVDPLVHMVNGFRLSGGHFKHMPKSTISMAQDEMTPFQTHPSPPICIASIDMTSGQRSQNLSIGNSTTPQSSISIARLDMVKRSQNVKTANQITSSSPATPKCIISIARLDMDQEATECQNSK